MDFDFDTPLVLRGTHSSKYDGIRATYGKDDPEMIPMWVADMDFAAAPAILDALQAEVSRGYMGYFTDSLPTSEAVAAWYAGRHDWNLDPRSVKYTHGVISGYGDVIATFSEPGDSVIVFAPVYHAFYRQIRAMGREVLESELVLRDGRFDMDLDALAGQLTGRERIITLCSPHNPGGRIWSDDELRAVADFCTTHDLILIADEIHLDLVMPGSRQTPAAVAAPDALDRMVVLTAASKAFNIAGLETGLLIAPDKALLKKLDRTILDRESSPNRFGMAGIRAAYEHGGPWLDAVCEYIAGNFTLLEKRLNALPGTRVMPMQATYLAWVDFTRTGLSDEELMSRFLDQAKVVPSPGPAFGTGGAGHLRLNIALPRPTLLQALDRIEHAFSDLQ